MCCILFEIEYFTDLMFIDLFYSFTTFKFIFKCFKFANGSYFIWL